jgi:hypothetical protein
VKWTKVNDPWRRRFALLPVCIDDGPTTQVVWLEWYWRRFCGLYYEVSFTDPNLPEPPQ